MSLSKLQWRLKLFHGASCCSFKFRLSFYFNYLQNKDKHFFVIKLKTDHSWVFDADAVIIIQDIYHLKYFELKTPTFCSHLL